MSENPSSPPNITCDDMCADRTPDTKDDVNLTPDSKSLPPVLIPQSLPEEKKKLSGLPRGGRRKRLTCRVCKGIISSKHNEKFCAECHKSGSCAGAKKRKSKSGNSSLCCDVKDSSLESSTTEGALKKTVSSENLLSTAAHMSPKPPAQGNSTKSKEKAVTPDSLSGNSTNASSSGITFGVVPRKDKLRKKPKKSSPAETSPQSATQDPLPQCATPDSVSQTATADNALCKTVKTDEEPLRLPAPDHVPQSWKRPLTRSTTSRPSKVQKTSCCSSSQSAKSSCCSSSQRAKSSCCSSSQSAKSSCCSSSLSAISSGVAPGGEIPARVNRRARTRGRVSRTLANHRLQRSTNNGNKVSQSRSRSSSKENDERLACSGQDKSNSSEKRKSEKKNALQPKIYEKKIKHRCKKCGYGCISHFMMDEHVRVHCQINMRHMTSCSVVLINSINPNQTAVQTRTTVKTEPNDNTTPPSTVSLRTLVCRKCSETFQTTDDFNFHIENKHSRLMTEADYESLRASIRCASCNVRFFTRLAFGLHKCERPNRNEIPSESSSSQSLVCRDNPSSTITSSASLENLPCEQFYPNDRMAESIPIHLGSSTSRNEAEPMELDEAEDLHSLNNNLECLPQSSTELPALTDGSAMSYSALQCNLTPHTVSSLNSNSVSSIINTQNFPTRGILHTCNELDQNVSNPAEDPRTDQAEFNNATSLDGMQAKFNGDSAASIMEDVQEEFNSAAGIDEQEEFNCATDIDDEQEEFKNAADTDERAKFNSATCIDVVQSEFSNAANMIDQTEFNDTTGVDVQGEFSNASVDDTTGINVVPAKLNAAGIDDVESNSMTENENVQSEQDQSNGPDKDSGADQPAVNCCLPNSNTVPECPNLPHICLGCSKFMKKFACKVVQQSEQITCNGCGNLHFPSPPETPPPSASGASSSNGSTSDEPAVGQFKAGSSKKLTGSSKVNEGAGPSGTAYSRSSSAEDACPKTNNPLRVKISEVRSLDSGTPETPTTCENSALTSSKLVYTSKVVAHVYKLNLLINDQFDDDDSDDGTESIDDTSSFTFICGICYVQFRGDSILEHMAKKHKITGAVTYH